MSNDVLYPAITVTLGDGNGFAIIAAVRKVLRTEISLDAAEAFQAEARTCTYDELIQLVQRTVNVEMTG